LLNCGVNKTVFCLEVLIYKCLQIWRHHWPQRISNFYIVRINVP